MSQASPATFSGLYLFRQCVADPENGDHWQEFVRKYNPLIVRNVASTWRKYGPSQFPAKEQAEDLLQNVYLAIVKNDFRMLRNFRGETEEEANAYLVRTVINETIAYLRRNLTLRRNVNETSLDELLKEAEDEGKPLPHSLTQRPPKLSEMEFIKVLEQCFTGQYRNRDILIFLLHFRDGYSATEIAAMRVCTLEIVSINNLLGRMKKELRKFLTTNV
jgi:RNA polymerase sigma factor (sigma-70 family)